MLAARPCAVWVSVAVYVVRWWQQGLHCGCLLQEEERLKVASQLPLGEGLQSKMLRDKLAELDREIEKFRAENLTLQNLRKDREEVRVNCCVLQGPYALVLPSLPFGRFLLDL